MKKTRILAALLAVSMSTLCSGSVFANEADIMLISEQAEEVVIAEAMPTAEMVSGIIAELVSDEETAGVLVAIPEEGAGQIHLHVTEETALLAADGTPVSFADLKVGDPIWAYHSTMVTRSLPPQSAAYAIIAADPAATALPLYIKAAEVTKTENAVEILSEDGSYLIRATEETEVVPYKTRNIVTLSDIKEGSVFLAWAETVTMSLPGIATPSKIMLFPEAAPETAEPLQGVYVNGEALAADIKVDGDVSFVPVRSISEKLGYTVTWNADERSVTVEKESAGAKIVLDSADITALSAARSASKLEKAVVLIEGTTYVPASFFEILTGSEVVTDDGFFAIEA